MQTEYFYPTLADRSSPKEWDEKNRPDLLKNATLQKEKLINAPTPASLDPMVDAEIRKRFNIHLS
jgi:trimethylamine--corrinoid protein Co-methyltransferase